MIRVVIDTNCFLSATLFPDSHIAHQVYNLLAVSRFFFSEATYAELEEVIFRKKFDVYQSKAARADFLKKIKAACAFVKPDQRVSLCRDEDDNRILEVAIEARADMILTGDQDLLVLGAFEGIPILKMAEAFSEKKVAIIAERRAVEKERLRGSG